MLDKNKITSSSVICKPQKYILGSKNILCTNVFLIAQICSLQILCGFWDGYILQIKHWCWDYSQVHSTSKKLLYQLDHLVQVCNQPGMEHTRKHVCTTPSIYCFVITIKFVLAFVLVNLNMLLACFSFQLWTFTQNYRNSFR